MPTTDIDDDISQFNNPLRDGRWDELDPVCNATKDLVDAVNALQLAFYRDATNSERYPDYKIREALAARAEAIRALVEAQAEYGAGDFYQG